MTVQILIRGRSYYVYGTTENITTQALQSGLEYDAIMHAKGCIGIWHVWPFDALVNHIQQRAENSIDITKLWDGIGLAARLQAAGLEMRPETIEIPHLEYVVAAPKPRKLGEPFEMETFELDFERVYFASKGFQMGWTVYFAYHNEVLYVNYRQKHVFHWVSDQSVPEG